MCAGPFPSTSNAGEEALPPFYLCTGLTSTGWLGNNFIFTVLFEERNLSWPKREADTFLETELRGQQ